MHQELDEAQQCWSGRSTQTPLIQAAGTCCVCSCSQGMNTCRPQLSRYSRHTCKSGCCAALWLCTSVMYASVRIHSSGPVCLYAPVHHVAGHCRPCKGQASLQALGLALPCLHHPSGYLSGAAPLGAAALLVRCSAGAVPAFAAIGVQMPSDGEISQHRRQRPSCLTR